MSSESFQFIDPGLLIDGDLELMLKETSPGDPIKGIVPEYKFVMLNSVTRLEMGRIHLRVSLTEKLKEYGGHIGYEVYEAFRGHHYAARSCRLLLPLIRNHGINPAVITCDPENIPSVKTIESLGASLVASKEVEREPGVWRPTNVYHWRTEMGYIQKNKEAWEEAFENKSPDWGKDVVSRIKSEKFPFLEKSVVDEISRHDLEDKVLGQFCCNNGRELLSLMGTGARLGIGFDIAENQVAFANESARQLGYPCTFIACDVLTIDDTYLDTFDALFITIGALCWFKDLRAFFGKASGCLRQNGILIINESHPVTNMLYAPGEEGYSDDTQNKLVYSYFEKTWEENDGMAYITGKPALSKTFTSFTHSMAKILTSISESGLRIQKLEEYDYDIAGGMFQHLDHKGIPLNYLLVAEKV